MITIQNLTFGGTFSYETPNLPSPPPPPVYLWSWGQPNSGRLGLGDTSVRSSPTQIGSLGTWASISSTGGGGMAQAIKTDGTFWSWGYNGYGQLGLGNTTDISSPVQIGALTNWSMAVGGLHSVAAKTDGTMWTWGKNNYGQLGLGNTTSVSSPVQVGALTTWSYVHASSSVFSLAIKTDGTLWSWGRNHLGYLGLGNTTDRSSPVQVGALTNWLTVSSAYYSAYAIKTDGTMWSWGNNYNGRLGLGNTAYHSSPVQIGALTTWSKVSGGRNGGSAAIKTDGTLWSWGNNGYGALGLGDTADRSSPVQVGALTSWSDIAAGNYHMAAVKTNGTLWIWGSNNYGCLGLGDTTRRSSPTQVGSLTNWLTVSAGYNTIFATSN
jgi:alpha-tubulin suppressor-like RCC1 family protein